MPFANFDDWNHCIQTMTDEEGHSQETAENICGALQAEAKADNGDPAALLDALREGAGLIADVGVDLVSGVDVPAVDSKWVMMKDGGGRRGHDYRALTPVLLSKADDDSADRRISYAAAMIPREPDKEGDVVATPTVETAAHDFLKSDGGIDTDHSLIDGEGQPVESWVLKEERTFDLPDGGEETYPAGTWMLGIEWGADAWDRITAGELTGLSIYGMAEHVPLERATAKDLAECPHCEGELSGAKPADGDTGKRQDSDTSDMGDQTDSQGGDGADGGTGDATSDATADGGADATLKDVTDTLDDLADSVSAVKEAVETDKQDAEAAAEMLGEEYDMPPGDVMDILSAAARADPGDLREALDEVDSSEMEAETDTDEDEEDDEMEQSADSAEKRAGEANMAKGHTGEGTRAAAIDKREGDGDATETGVPSYAAVADEHGGDD